MGNLKRQEMQTAAVATGNGTSLNAAAAAGVAFQVTGTFVGTVTFEATIDESTWVSLRVENIATGVVSTTSTAPAAYIAGAAGILQIRARVSAWTSGEITVVGVGTEEGAQGAQESAGTATQDVNIIQVVGTATNVGGGNVDAGTQTITLADDDPAVTLLGTIDADTSTIAGDTTSIDTKTAALGTGVMTGSTPFTLATDDTQFGSVGAAADVDGNVHGQLRFIGEQVDTLEALLGHGTGTMATSISWTLATDDTQYGALGSAADVDGNIHGQLRYTGETIATQLAFGTGAMAAAHAFTLATDDTQFGAVGAAADPDGNIHGQLRSIAENTDGLEGALVRAEKNPTILTQAVATPGTREAFAATQQVVYFHIEARRVDGVNTNPVYIGTGDVDKDGSQQIVLAPGDTYEFTAPVGTSTDLDAWFVDAITATDGITGFYLSA